MTKATAEEQAASLAKKLLDTRRQAAIATVEWAMGRAVFDMLRRGDTLTRADLVAHFDAVVAAEGPQSVDRMQAEEVIARLRPPAAG